MGIVAGTVGMGLFSLSGIFCRERVVQNSDEPKVLDCFRFLFKNKPLLLIVCSNILATVGGVTDTFAQYFYIFSLGAASWGTIIGIPGVMWLAAIADVGVMVIAVANAARALKNVDSAASHKKRGAA